MKIALNGASGFVASHLKEKFSDFVVLKRDDSEDEIVQKLKGVDAVFNLAGAPIIKRWSETYKKVLLESRVETTKKLVNTINKSQIKHFISTSAIGAYPDGKFDESYGGYGDDFLGSLAKQWEEEAYRCNKPTTIIRFGVILGSDGGALKEMLLPFKLGVGGIIGDGKMMTSWIDVKDLVSIYEYVLQKKLTGILNATAPHPVSNFEFTKALGKELKRPTIFPLPLFVLKLLFGEGATVLTASKEIYPKRLQESGFEFKYPNIQTSLAHLLK